MSPVMREWLKKKKICMKKFSLMLVSIENVNDAWENYGKGNVGIIIKKKTQQVHH